MNTIVEMQRLNDIFDRDSKCVEVAFFSLSVISSSHFVRSAIGDAPSSTFDTFRRSKSCSSSSTGFPPFGNVRTIVSVLCFQFLFQFPPSSPTVSSNILQL